MEDPQGICDQLHRKLKALVSEGPSEEPPLKVPLALSIRGNIVQSINAVPSQYLSHLILHGVELLLCAPVSVAIHIADRVDDRVDVQMLLVLVNSRHGLIFGAQAGGDLLCDVGGLGMGTQFKGLE